MALGPWQILLVLALVVLLFGGKGKISSIMGDMGKGITSFKKGLKDGAETATDKADDAINVTPPKDIKPDAKADKKTK
ncbi:twin-arginine translocase TatA/TatE family subunit [Fretibacter rubidus]|uniref:twin-arginine translocase TatA/TatE family subunit n=1 Tax=Fretibacter rubidus TaxID=570162 RepID=UPI00352BBC0D